MAHPGRLNPEILCPLSGSRPRYAGDRHGRRAVIHSPLRPHRSSPEPICRACRISSRSSRDRMRSPHRVGPALLEIDMCRSPKQAPRINPQSSAWKVVPRPRLRRIHQAPQGVRRRSTAQPLGPSRDTARSVCPTRRRASVGRMLSS